MFIHTSAKYLLSYLLNKESASRYEHIVISLPSPSSFLPVLIPALPTQIEFLSTPVIRVHCRLSRVPIETINNRRLNDHTRCHRHVAIGNIHCNSSNSFLQKSRKLNPSGGYIHRKKLLKMLISITYSKIVEIVLPPLFQIITTLRFNFPILAMDSFSVNSEYCVACLVW